MAVKQDRTPPLLRALALLERIAQAASPLSLREATEGCALPKPTVHRMLQTLQRAGLVTREAEGRVSPGPRLARLALDTLLNASVRAPRHAILSALADDVGETVNLTMLEGSEVVYLDRVEAAWPLRVTLQPGSRVPLHCTASGKLLLASLPAARRRKLVASLDLARFTERTLVEPRALETELARIRRDGYATDDEEYLAGLVCVAVPVTLSKRRTAACVAVHAPVARMSLATAVGHLPALRHAAEALAQTFETAAA